MKIFFKLSANLFFLIFLSLVLITCNDIEFVIIQPANPPVGLELKSITEGNHDGDYLLIFRSENTTNNRFGGFLIYTAASKEAVLQTSKTEYMVGYELGPLNPNDSANYNTGINSEIVILFSDVTEQDSVITIKDKEYSITTKLPVSELFPETGNWLTLRSYLYDSEKQGIYIFDSVPQVSSPGNPVQIKLNKSHS